MTCILNRNNNYANRTYAQWYVLWIKIGNPDPDFFSSTITMILTSLDICKWSKSYYFLQNFNFKNNINEAEM